MNNTFITTREQIFANQPLHLTLSTLATVISIIGSSLIVGTYIFYKDIRTPSRHIIVCISLSDLTVSLCNFFVIFGGSPASDKEDDYNNQICVISSFIVTTAMQCSFMWTMALAIFLNVLVVGRNPKRAESLLHPYFHVVCWLVPLTINVVALCLQKLGTPHDYVSSGWCWIHVRLERKDNGYYIANKNDAVLWMTLDGKLIEITTYIVVLFLFMRIKLYIREKIKVFEESDREVSTPVFVTPRAVQAAKNTDRKLIFIPFALILLRIWGTVRYVLFILENEKLCDDLKLSEKILMICQVFGDNVIGAVNCVLFCFLTPKVWNHMKVSWRSFAKNCCSQRKIPSEKRRLLTEAI